MSKQYTIDQLATNSKVSITSINNLKKKNQELFNKNSTRKQRKIYYNQAVMDFCLSYYFPDGPIESDKNADSAEVYDTNIQKAENPPLESSSIEPPPETLTKEIDALKAEIDALKKQLEEKELERKELIRQNGALILTLQQEKQEKQLFLPAPKKSLSDRMKSIFKGKEK